MANEHEEIFDEETKKEIKHFFEHVPNEVELLMIYSETENPDGNHIAHHLMDKLAELSGGKLKVRKEKDSPELREKYHYYGTPAFIFPSKPNMIYNGLPAGHEFTPFLEDIMAIASNEAELSVSAAEKIAKIDKPIKILVFITPTCPYCPYAVRDAHKFAFYNKNIEAHMIEALEFPEMSNKYMVSAVPKIVIEDENGNKLDEWEGALPTKHFAERVLEAFQKLKE